MVLLAGRGPTKGLGLGVTPFACTAGLKTLAERVSADDALAGVTPLGVLAPDICLSHKTHAHFRRQSHERNKETNRDASLFSVQKNTRKKGERMISVAQHRNFTTANPTRRNKA